MRLSSTVRPPNRAMFWNVRATPSAAISLGRMRGDVAAVEHDAAGVGLVEARDHVEQRGLAGAVGADDRDDAALGDVDRHVLDCGDAAEALGDTRDRKLDGSRRDLVGTPGAKFIGRPSHARGGGPMPTKLPAQTGPHGQTLPGPARRCRYARPSLLPVTAMSCGWRDLSAAAAAPPRAVVDCIARRPQQLVCHMP